MNLLYYQAGGPTSVINQTALGVSSAAYTKFDKIIAARGGLDGVVHEVFDNVLKCDIEEMAVQSSAGFEASRLEFGMLHDKAVDRLFRVLREHKISHIVANGGGDTAFSALALYEGARKAGIHLNIVHAAKTIDNDLPMDYSPGFGTAATYIVNTFIGNFKEAKGSRQVRVDITMGRDAGWLAAAALLGKEHGAEPHAIYVPEHKNVSPSVVAAKARESYARHGFCHIVMSESYGQNFCGLGKAELSGNDLPYFLEKELTGQLGRRVIVEKYGYPQRNSDMPICEFDRRLAFEVGLAAGDAVRHAEKPLSIYVKLVTKADGAGFELSPIPLSEVTSLGEKREVGMPSKYVGPPGVINDCFLDYIRPVVGLISGRVVSRPPEAAVPKLLPPYTGPLRNDEI